MSPGFDLIPTGRCGPQQKRAASAASKMAASPHSHRSNGLPCDTIHWSIEDDDRSFWLYTACGLVRIARTELDAWIADPKRRIATDSLGCRRRHHPTLGFACLFQSSCREVHRWQTVDHAG